MTPTDEQLAIIDAAPSGRSIMAEAYAGCTKTTTIVLAAQHIHEPTLATAFNVKNAKELQQKLPSNFTVKTMNALGHSAWCRAQGITRAKLDDRKTGKLVTETAKDLKIQLKTEDWHFTRQTVQLAMNRGLLPEAQIDDWMDIAHEAGTPSNDLNRTIELARDVLKRDIELAKRGEMSFDDQIYCPVVLGGAWPKFPTIIIDEYQDLNPLNFRMIQLCLRIGGRLIVAGDKRQGIYQFRGADANAMDALRAQVNGDWLDLPLTMTFRCPKKIVDRQKDHAPGFRAYSGNRDGIVSGLEKLNYSLFDEPITVLCRNNAPLLALAFKLLRQGTGVHMLGRDIGKGLIALSRKLCPADDMDSTLCRSRIEEWAGGEHDEKTKDSVQDRAESLLAVLSNARDAGQLRTLLEQLFARENGIVMLSSIHRAKGLEFPRVLHLDPWRIKKGQEQENNLSYVCETRTQNELVIGSLEALQ